MEDLAANPNDGSSLILYALLPSKCGNLRAHSILGDPGYTARVSYCAVQQFHLCCVVGGDSPEKAGEFTDIDDKLGLSLCRVSAAVA